MILTYAASKLQYIRLYMSFSTEALTQNLYTHMIISDKYLMFSDHNEETPFPLVAPAKVTTYGP